LEIDCGAGLLTMIMGYRAMTKDFLMYLDDKMIKPHSDFIQEKRDLIILIQAIKRLEV
jgi:hypothetical protein